MYDLLETKANNSTAIQAEILLAVFLFIVGGGALETNYRISSAVSLALGYGMNRITPRSPGDPTEGERIAVFWKMFCLDRLWAIAHVQPAIMRLRGDSSVVITTPWPLTLEEYTQVAFLLLS